MEKHKKISAVLISILVTVFIIGTMLMSIFINSLYGTLQTNIFAFNANRQRSVHKIISQLRAAAENANLDPATTCLYTPPAKPEYKAEFITKGTKIWSREGGSAEVIIYLKNVGSTTWFGDSSGCGKFNFVRLGTARDRDRSSIFYNPGDSQWIQANRIKMVEARVEPGEIATFAFNANAPNVNDIFREYFEPIVEAKQWIENPGATGYIDIYVGENSAEADSYLFYLGKSGQVGALDLSGDPEIHVDISDQKAIVKFGNTVVREYKVSTGTFKTPTPIGRFKILSKQELRIGAKAPHYRMPLFQLLTKNGVGFHALPYLANDKGTFWKEALNHIGQRVSHGCIRFLPEDAEDLYNLTDVGMPVVIHA